MHYRSSPVQGGPVLFLSVLESNIQYKYCIVCPAGKRDPQIFDPGLTQGASRPQSPLRRSGNKKLAAKLTSFAPHPHGEAETAKRNKTAAKDGLLSHGRQMVDGMAAHGAHESDANNRTTSPATILIVGAGVSGLLLAQYLRKTGVPFRIFERDGDLASRGLGWGLTLHWSLPALRSLLPEHLLLRLPEAYVDRTAVEEGKASTFPFFNLSTGELKASTPTAPESQRIRVNRAGFRRLLATGLDIQAGNCPCGNAQGSEDSSQLLTGRFPFSSGARRPQALGVPKTDPSPSISMTALRTTAAWLWPAMAGALAFEARCSRTCPSTRYPSG